MKIYIASDHAGFELKGKLIPFLENLGYMVSDFGPHEFNPHDDYPDFITPLAKVISQEPESRGIILGGSGQGEAMVANRFSHVRSVVYYGGNHEILELSRKHNDANILSLGARFITEAEAKESVKIWLETEFSNEERHVRRISKIDQVVGNL